MKRSTRGASLLALLLLGLMPALASRAGSPAYALPAAPPEVSVPEAPRGAFIRINPAPDKVVVNLPVWLAVDPSVWRPSSATTDVAASTTTTMTQVPIEPPPATATTLPPPPTRFTVTVRPLYVDWDLGDGEKARCFSPGTIYNPSLPLSTQVPDCKHTYVRPAKEVTIRAAITYGTVALVEVPNEPPREEILDAQVARDELKVQVNELQALDPGLRVNEMFPPGLDNGAPPSSAQVPLPSSGPGSGPGDGEGDEQGGDEDKDDGGFWGGLWGGVKDAAGATWDGIKVGAFIFKESLVETAKGAWFAVDFVKDVVVGVAKGLGGLVGDVLVMGRGLLKLTGLWDVGEWVVTGEWSFDSFSKNWRGLGRGIATVFTTNPWTTAKAVFDAIVDPMQDSWSKGQYGEAVGRGVFEVLAVVVGTKGLDKLSKANKLGKGAKLGRIPWTSWAGYPKVVRAGREYASVGGRLYTQHAVERMLPSGLGKAAGGVKGRSVAPQWVEDVLRSSKTVRNDVLGPNGEARVQHLNGSLEVITEGDIVVTIITH